MTKHCPSRENTDGEITPEITKYKKSTQSTKLLQLHLTDVSTPVCVESLSEATNPKHKQNKELAVVAGKGDNNQIILFSLVECEVIF